MKRKTDHYTPPVEEWMDRETAILIIVAILVVAALFVGAY